MRSLYDVIDQGGMQPSDIVYLHVFYRAPTDEAAYRQRILESFPECTDGLIVLTPVVSYPSAGAEVEIDAIAISGGAVSGRQR